MSGQAVRRLVPALCMPLLWVSLLVSCNGDPDRRWQGRWFNASQVALGETLYAEHCQSCHGAKGRGTESWKDRLPDGSLPPPPLNGTGHTWHHSLDLLHRIIKEGGQLFGGKMPAFKDKLTANEQRTLLAYIQSLWSDRVYSIWVEQVDKKNKDI